MKVIMVIPRGFPYDAAYSLRARSFVQLFHECECEVKVICQYLAGIQLENNKLYGIFSGVEVYPLEDKNKPIGKNLLPKAFENKLNVLIKDETPDLVFTSSMYDSFMRILRVIKKKNIPLLIDSCERYHPSTFKGGILSPHYLNFLRAWYWGYTKANGVIAISSYLKRYYDKYSGNVEKIPTILDVRRVPYKTECEEPDSISLLFAGSFGRTKDSIKPFVVATSKMGDKAKRFVFNVYGCNEKDIENHLGSNLYKKMRKQIYCHGYVAQDLINKIYQESDYGIFFRPHIWSSEAGFSTKLGEGMSAGTPFIVNNTSDIAQYIRTGKNGFIIDDESEVGIINILESILRLSKAEREEIRIEARKTAEKYFDCKNYVEQFRCILDKCIVRR